MYGVIKTVVNRPPVYTCAIVADVPLSHEDNNFNMHIWV